ncbi:MAG: methylated-DNA--[protein]-cysteine S-methyltransferase [Chitinophagales bacterium]|nr:methylated-DNA--[protein]-cysteine S-methyltransferase [Bacteroidota bacterium]MCB9226189.1 methylated-DNA--[protein]-cysteine S-methyltransferase [Chitinophagales bacterium]
MNSQKIYTYYYKTLVGELILGDFNNKLCLADWRYRKMRNAIDKRISGGLNAQFEEQKTELIEKTILQLEEYFSVKRTVFDLPLQFVGTNFQQEVWNTLIQIPYGTTSSYIDLAKKMNNEKAIRAIAGANGANAISIIVPCHRIIGKDGSLVGYAGGLPAKKKLLQLENPEKENQLELF